MGIWVGIDIAKHVHWATAIDDHGQVLLDQRVANDPAALQQLIDALAGLDGEPVIGLDVVGGIAGLAQAMLLAAGFRLVHISGLAVNRARQGMTGGEHKSDPRDARVIAEQVRTRRDLPIDAENAARAVLAGTATATPKRADGTVEMLRQLKITRDTAVKTRTQAIITLKALVVTAPTDLREPLDGLSKMALIDRCAGLRPGPVTTPTAAAKHALRALARRWLALTEEIKAHDQLLQTLTTQHAPQLVAQFGIGSDTAAELLVLAGDNPERIRSEAAFAKLCGACPVPASSGKTVRHRLNRGGHRQANAALYRVVIVRMRFHQPTIDYVTRRTAEGKSKAEIIRCVKALPRPRVLPPDPTICPRPGRSPPSLTTTQLDDYRSVNAVIESFWARMQTELLDRRRWTTRVELANAIFEYLEIFHNWQRRHSALGWRTPVEFEKLHATDVA